ncbi:hypothetical protein BU25DRAFT_176303 [Macroventuria anomochaeta]|uniref:Uncharacterized protein n=1 Tax=Macroventuria anomochaeta TaxID=301207 RepID=A0ACB6RNZ9_9PLEO|nr:uncharacterized protein BU25DRAFT_176303 [Macroventuria anomochaeta]KAF2623538.1 hypothetical protein BU25DRAFT_176303 [Macroventuria anomochaeta]
MDSITMQFPIQRGCTMDKKIPLPDAAVSSTDGSILDETMHQDSTHTQKVIYDRPSKIHDTDGSSNQAWAEEMTYVIPNRLWDHGLTLDDNLKPNRSLGSLVRENYKSRWRHKWGLSLRDAKSTGAKGTAEKVGYSPLPSLPKPDNGLYEFSTRGA